jgi:predicted transposase YdaD
MTKPFDATLKDLGQDCPADFLAEFDAPPTAPVSVLNVDLSTVTTAADLILGLGRPLREVVHFEFHASADANLHRDTLAYNALLYRRFGVPVHSILVLLRPRAQHRNVTGTVRYEARPGRGKMEFQYEVIRLWERPADHLLAGPLGLLPLAVLGQLPEGTEEQEGLSEVIDRLVERLQREAKPGQDAKLLTAAFVLTGLRIKNQESLRALYRGVRAMRESVSYQMILDEGRAEGEVKALQQTLLRQGRKKFGSVPRAVRATVTGITDVPRLERLTDRLLDVATWQELLEGS